VPTARELLEQADALMRRNRAAADDNIPVLTDVVPSVQEAKSRFAPPPVAATPPAAEALDDVPVLTDEVEEIEAVALDPVLGEGEPSAWLDFQETRPSVIGDAPDSIAIVPAVDLRRQAPAPAVDEIDDLDEELAAAIAAAPRENETLRPPLAKPPAPLPAAPPVAEIRTPAVIAGGAAALLHGEPVAPVVAAPTPPPPQAPPASPPAVPDTVQWEAMAEEIRMQVLQRIDLFTDTGLRTQLGERLQPIVDRASADLVATINQHVGELLRAYVAEAIEREIDSWRQNH
jgi:hypothetical protein